MKIKLKRCDYAFILVILSGLILHILCIFSLPMQDEGFYHTVPLRLFNGESLLQNEWHLSQFSSVFLYLFDKLFVTLNGSTDGIILYGRAVYIIIHTVFAFLLYGFFRKKGIWAAVATAVFYFQIPYRLAAISYNSVLALALILFCFCLLKIYGGGKEVYHIGTGVCFAIMTVCNPLLCILCFIYLAVCFFFFVKNRRNICAENSFIRKYCSAKAVIYIAVGIGIVAIICIIFYFSTGGTLTSVFSNIPNLLSASEYTAADNSVLEKCKDILSAFNKLSFKLPFILPAVFIAALIDKKRHTLSHKLTYLVATLITVFMFIIKITVTMEKDTSILSILLPITLFSAMCYLLTEHRNIKLFRCMFIPGIVVSLFTLFTARTILASIGWSLISCSISGIFFISDMIKELSLSSDKKKDVQAKRRLLRNSAVCSAAVCIALQLIFEIFCYSYIRLPDFSADSFLQNGPCEHLSVSSENAKSYYAFLNDLTEIKKLSDEASPVLIITNEPWMYLYIDRPFATYTSWHESVSTDNLKDYYDQNPYRKPKYIYINDTSIDYKKNIYTFSRMFSCSKTSLSRGVLLTVRE